MTDLPARLRAEVAMMKGEAAAWGVDTYGDLPRNLKLMDEAAARIEVLEAALKSVKLIDANGKPFMTFDLGPRGAWSLGVEADTLSFFQARDDERLAALTPESPQ